MQYIQLLFAEFEQSTFVQILFFVQTITGLSLGIALRKVWLFYKKRNQIGYTEDELLNLVETLQDNATKNTTALKQQAGLITDANVKLEQWNHFFPVDHEKAHQLCHDVGRLTEMDNKSFSKFSQYPESRALLRDYARLLMSEIYMHEDYGCMRKGLAGIILEYFTEHIILSLDDDDERIIGLTPTEAIFDEFTDILLKIEEISKTKNEYHVLDMVLTSKKILAQTHNAFTLDANKEKLMEDAFRTMQSLVDDLDNENTSIYSIFPCFFSFQTISGLEGGNTLEDLNIDEEQISRWAHTLGIPGLMASIIVDKLGLDIEVSDIEQQHNANYKLTLGKSGFAGTLKGGSLSYQEDEANENAVIFTPADDYLKS